MKRGALRASISSVAILWAVGLVHLGAAHAQATAADQSQPGTKSPASQATVSEVVVTGVRRSINQSINIKRNLNVVADVISAEDVGKFPDTNIAESLQRITGVQITRERGEGKYVNVRGLPSDFNYVTMNGEAVASASNNQVQQISDRNFDFTILPSEFISSLEVYKSPDASLEEGPISATINVKTVMPLDLGRRRIVLSAYGQYLTSSDKFAPNVTGLFSDVFAGRKVGITLGYSHYESKVDENSTTAAQLDKITLGGVNYLMADSIGANRFTEDRSRDTFYQALQYAPTDDLLFSLVGLQSFYTGDGYSGGFTMRPVYVQYGPPGHVVSMTADPNNVLTSIVTDNTYVGADTYHKTDERYLQNYTGSVKWTPGAWQIDAGAAYSWSKSKIREIGLDTLVASVFGVGAPVTAGYQFIPGEGAPSMILENFNPLNAPAYYNNYVGGNVLRRTDESKSGHLDVVYKFDGGILDSLAAGMRYTDRTRRNIPIFLIDFKIRMKQVMAQFADPMVILQDYSGKANVIHDIMQWSPSDYLNDYYGGSYDKWAAAATPSINPTEQYAISERVFDGYVMANYKFDAGVPVHGNLGVRLAHTRQIVDNNAIDLAQVNCNATTRICTYPTAATPQRFDRDYFDVLPSFNIAADLTPTVVLRGAVAKVMSRPTLDRLVPRYSVGYPPLQVTGGNPDLNPFRATQFDLSLEWYPRQSTILSGALFRKNISSFIENGSRPIVIGGVTGTEVLPVNGSGGYVEGAEFNYTELFTFLPGIWSGLGVQLNATYAKGQVNADPADAQPAHPFEGLSPWTYNAVLIYERDRVSLRLAYNHRDAFLDDHDVRGAGTTREYTKAFGTLDFQASYQITPNVQAFAQGVNLTDQPLVTYMTTIDGKGNYPLSWSHDGIRLDFGVRMTF